MTTKRREKESLVAMVVEVRAAATSLVLKVTAEVEATAMAMVEVTAEAMVISEIRKGLDDKENPAEAGSLLVSAHPKADALRHG